MKTKLLTLSFLFLVVLCNLVVLPYCYGQTLIYSLSYAYNSSYTMPFWNTLYYISGGYIIYVHGDYYGNYYHARILLFDFINGLLKWNFYVSVASMLISHDIKGVAYDLANGRLYFGYASGSSTSYMVTCLLSDSGVSSLQYTNLGNGDVIRGVALRSEGGVWVIKTNGYGYYIPNTYTNIGSTGMKYAILVQNSKDMLLTIDANNNPYLFINGTFYSLQTGIINPYPSYNPQNNWFYAVKIGGYIYVGWKTGNYFGWDKISITDKKVVYQEFGVISLFPPTEAPTCIGFDGNAEKLTFVYYKNGVFYFRCIDGNVGQVSIGYDNTLIPVWYIHKVIFQLSSLSGGSNLVAKAYQTNNVGSPPIFELNYNAQVTISYIRYPPYTNDTIEVSGILYRNGIQVQRQGAFILLNGSYIDNIATVNVVWKWNYTIPPFYGYGDTITLVFTFRFYDVEMQRTAIDQTVTIKGIINNVSIPPPTWVISPLYVFEVNLLTPTIGWVTNFTYVFHVKFAEINATDGSLLIPNGIVIVWLNNAILKQLEFKDKIETQTSIMFNRSGYYTLQFNAYNSSNALVGRKVWYINISGQPTLPPAPSKPIPSVIEVIGATTFSNLLIILLLLLTPIFIFAKLGSPGIIVGGIIGLMLCYIAGLVQLWMLVLAGIGIIAIIFFGYRGGG